MASLLTLTYSQPTKSLQPGEVLVHEGDRGGTLYILESGRLVVERDGVQIATIKDPGAMIGEMSVLLQIPNSATVKAEKDATVRVVADALAYLERTPLVALRVATLVCNRLNETSKLLVEMRREHKGKPAEQGLLSRLVSALATPSGEG
jgi:CRP-like cAMP-binding protein